MIKPKKITAKKLARRVQMQLASMESYGRFWSAGRAELIVDQLLDGSLTRAEHQLLADQWTEINRGARSRFWFAAGLPDPLARAYEIVDPDEEVAP